MSERPFKRISIIRLGYISLTTAAIFASCKVEVVGVDVNQHAVATINQDEVHIVEPDLDMVVRTNIHMMLIDRKPLKAARRPEGKQVSSFGRWPSRLLRLL